jgi:hypothetical protein
MKSLIICEGATDLVLVQYFMETVNNWTYSNVRYDLHGFQLSKGFIKGGSELVIGECGGCGRINSCFRKALDTAYYSTHNDEAYDNIVIICDRDEANTVENFEKSIIESIAEIADTYPSSAENNTWMQCAIINQRNVAIPFRVLLLIIPFEKTGALETFLLDAVSEKDEYDKHIIEKGNAFVDTIDHEERYLKHRRHKTKAKFDVYFSIRTPYEQFGQRQDILKGVAWEKYESVQDAFIKLKELG